MPLLCAEPSLFPESLFLGDDPCPERVPDWSVIYTRARAEKALARSLLHRQVGFFLPLHEQRWRSPAGRMRCSYLPLFPGYLFLHGGDEARLHALETGLVSRCLPVVEQVGLHRDLARVYRLISSGAALLPEDRLQPGNPVEFVVGPLAGLQGKVIRRGKQLRLVVEVELLKRGVSVEIESHMVQPVRSGPSWRAPEEKAQNDRRISSLRDQLVIRGKRVGVPGQPEVRLCSEGQETQTTS